MGKCHLQWQTVPQPGWGSYSPLSALRTCSWDGPTYSRQGVGLPCGQAIEVTAASLCAIRTDTHTDAFYKLGWTNHVLYTKHHQLSALKAFPRTSHSPLTIQGKEGPLTPGSANTASWSALKSEAICPGHAVSQWKPTSSKSHPSAFSTDLCSSLCFSWCPLNWQAQLPEPSWPRLSSQLKETPFRLSNLGQPEQVELTDG